MQTIHAGNMKVSIYLKLQKWTKSKKNLLKKFFTSIFEVLSNLTV